jgi:two-component system sensor histidine kinase DesK
MSADLSHRKERAVAAPPPTGGGAAPLRRFEWCVRSSAYAVMALELFVVLPTAMRQDNTTAQVGLILVVITVHIVTNVIALGWAFDSLKVSRRAAALLPGWRLAVTVVSTTAAVVCVYVVFGTGGTAVAVYVVGLTWAAVAPALSYRTALAGVGAIALALGVLLLSSMDGPLMARIASSLSLAAVAFILCASVWLSGWMLRVYWELNEARVDSARLAIADERLRISRDLHDVFGRTLATVSVKSELAAELARRGRSEDAAVEIGQVSRIAEQAGQEIRRVLHGYREADLGVELQGARSLLTAAGVDCTVEMTPDRLGPAATSTLAWVTREAVTNVIRHARASRATISLTGVDPVVLTIVNDGALPSQPSTSGAGFTPGQGLLGMAERVAAAGGVLQHGREAGRFTVRVELPTGAGA